MKHALLLLCDFKIEDLNRWITFVTNYNFFIYVHLDVSLKRQRERILYSEHVLGVYSMFDVHSGKTGKLDAILYLLSIVSAHDSYDYIHILDAKDFPLKGLEELDQFCCTCSGPEFMEIRPLSKLNYPLYYEGKYQMSITGKYVDFLINSCNLDCSLYSQIAHFPYPETIFLPTFIMKSSYSSKVGNVALLFEENDGKDWWKIATSSAFFLCGVNDVDADTLWQQIQYYLLVKPSLLISPSGCWQTSGFYGHYYDTGLGNALLDIFRLLNIDSIGDFGCGPGWYTALLYRNGYAADGYDGNPYVEEMSALFFENGFYCQCVDLSEEVKTEEPFDVVLSLEVGEHIPADREDVFFLNLIRNARKYIALSWAVEGQYGDGHVNCRSNYYIISRMKKHGFYENTIVSQYLRSHATYGWFKNTIMFFEKQNIV